MDSGKEGAPCDANRPPRFPCLLSLLQAQKHTDTRIVSVISPVCKSSSMRAFYPLSLCRLQTWTAITVSVGFCVIVPESWRHFFLPLIIKTETGGGKASIPESADSHVALVIAE